MGAHSPGSGWDAVTGCPHFDALRVEGRCYWCCKSMAVNGHRSRLRVEQAEFVGFVSDTGPVEPELAPERWLSAAERAHAHIDKQLEELAARRDVAPNWFALARAIVKDDE